MEPTEASGLVIAAAVFLFFIVVCGILTLPISIYHWGKQDDAAPFLLWIAVNVSIWIFILTGAIVAVDIKRHNDAVEMIKNIPTVELHESRTN